MAVVVASDLLALVRPALRAAAITGPDSESPLQRTVVRLASVSSKLSTEDSARRALRRLKAGETLTTASTLADELCCAAGDTSLLQGLVHLFPRIEQASAAAEAYYADQEVSAAEVTSLARALQRFSIGYLKIEEDAWRETPEGEAAMAQRVKTNAARNERIRAQREAVAA